MSANGIAITRAERQDILRVARQGTRVAKATARRRSAELKADFEGKLASEFKFDQQPVWKAAVDAATRVAADADRHIADECSRLGIPQQFRPSLHIGWFGRGENASKERRAKLRKVAVSRIAAIERTAIDEIERASLEFSTEVISNGLSDRAQTLLATMPTVAELRPPPDIREVARALGHGADVPALNPGDSADESGMLR